MSETRLSETKPRKVVRRSIAIGVGVLFIALLVGLIVVMVTSISAINDLNSNLNLDKSTVWVNDMTLNQPANFYTDWSPGFSASYCGYISAQATSNTSSTYVRVIYASHGVVYDNQISVGSGGTAAFPVLPCNNIEVRVGNTNLLDGARITVTVTYHY